MIRRGEEWGHQAPLPDGGVVVRDDAEARRVVEAARRGGHPIPPLGLLGGDLCRTVGGVGDEARLRTPAATTLVCDLGSVLLDGRLHWFISSLMANGPGLRGRVFMAMNAAWFATWRAAPRAHPGDGLLDVIDIDVTRRELFRVRSRMRSGDHLPHPGIKERRVPATQVDLGRRMKIYLDGEQVGRFRNLSIRVEPDALTVVV